MVMLLALSMILTSLGTLGFTAFAAANNNTLVNGNFENGTTGFSSSGTATFEVISDPDNSSNHILHVVGGEKGGGYHQLVNVEKNTDYVWTFRMKDLGNAGGTKICVHPESNWTSIITSLTEDSSEAYSAVDGSGVGTVATYNKTWQTFTVKFNSGENTAVKLWHNMWANTRDLYMDDWRLYRETKEGEIVNADFEDSTYSYSASGTTTFETIVDPDDATNHILHVVGAGGYHQLVSVKANTDYVWTFRMKDIGDTGTTKICVHPETTWDSIITEVVEDSSEAYSALSAGAASVATYNKTWQTFTIKFNSGANTKVKLWHNMWAANREVYMDDWTLEEYVEEPVPEEPKDGEIVNGNFEKGSDSYSSSSLATFEVIADPDNANNHILHAVGGEKGGGYHQVVNVEANTDYVWSFRMKDLGNTGGTKILVHPETTWDSIVTEIFENSSQAYSKLDNGGAFVATFDKTWQTFYVKFNSGENTKVKLWHNMWASTREVYMDDWSLAKIGAINNAGFENETVADGYTVENITTAVETTEVHSGSQSLKLDGAGTWENALLTQTVKVMPNTDYSWTFWYKSYTPGKSSYVAVRNADGSKVLPSFINSTGTIVKNASFVEERAAGGIAANWHETLVTESWNKYVVTFNSGNNAEVLLTINMHATGRGGYIDDWSVEEWNVTAGDANNDGTIDAVDLSVLKKYLLTGIKTFYKSGLDANETNGIDIRDLVSLKKKLSDLNKLDGYSLVWSDDFGTTILDDSKWSLRSHMKGRDDLEIRYDESAVSVNNGSVTLSSGRVDEDTYYTNASLTTSDTMVFKYGYVEMRAKVPYGAPAFPSFWMQSALIENPEVMGEIDIFEHFCKTGDGYIQSGIHKWYKDEALTHILNNSIGSHSFGSEALAEEWHNYGLLWTPEKLDFMVDGVAYHTISLEGNQSYTKYNADGSTTQITSDMDVFHDYFYLIMNNYLNTPNGKGDDGYTANADTEFPIDYEIDYVRLYQKAGEGGIKLLNQ